MAKSDRLKDLITKLGGTPPATDSISDCLDSLCGCKIGGGGEQYIRIVLDTSTGKFDCNMSYEEVCDLCFNESWLPVMGVYASSGINWYLESCGDCRTAYPAGYVRLKFFLLGSTDSYNELYYMADGTITDTEPGGK